MHLHVPLSTSTTQNVGRVGEDVHVRHFTGAAICWINYRVHLESVDNSDYEIYKFVSDIISMGMKWTAISRIQM